LAGLVWWVGCRDATHALVPRGGVGL
jgi:hypothetical protein